MIRLKVNYTAGLEDGPQMQVSADRQGMKMNKTGACRGPEE